MLRTAGLLAFLKKAWSAGIDGQISLAAAAQLLGGWDLTETGLAPASPSGLLWTHLKRGTPANSDHFLCRPAHGRRRSGRQ
jgi:hypothetical protein